MNVFHLCIGLAAVALLSCNQRTSPSGTVLPDSVFVRYYADRMILEEDNRIQKHDSLLSLRRLDSLNSRYTITGAQADAQLNSYKTDLGTWKQFFERVSRRIESLQQLH